MVNDPESGRDGRDHVGHQPRPITRRRAGIGGVAVERVDVVEGVGEDFFPGTYDSDPVDQTVPVSDQDSFLTARAVTREEGRLIGGSGGMSRAVCSTQVQPSSTCRQVV